MDSNLRKVLRTYWTTGAEVDKQRAEVALARAGITDETLLNDVVLPLKHIFLVDLEYKEALRAGLNPDPTGAWEFFARKQSSTVVIRFWPPTLATVLANDADPYIIVNAPLSVRSEVIEALMKALPMARVCSWAVTNGAKPPRTLQKIVQETTP